MLFFLSLNKCKRFCILYRLFVTFLLSSFRVISWDPWCDGLFSCIFLVVLLFMLWTKTVWVSWTSCVVFGVSLFHRRNWSNLMSIGPGIWTEPLVSWLPSAHQKFPADDRLTTSFVCYVVQLCFCRYQYALGEVIIDTRLAQSVERESRISRVAGSYPTGGARLLFLFWPPFFPAFASW